MTSPPQTKGSEIDRFHHVGHIVRSIDEGVALYRRLGFLPTPTNYYVMETEGHAGKAIGPINAYSPLKFNFLEIVSVANSQTKPGTGEPQVIVVPPEQRDALAANFSKAGDMITSWFTQFEGMHILALRTKDVDETARRLKAAGVGNNGANTVNRKIDTDKGVRVVPTRFLEIGEGANSTLPEGRVAIAENPDAELLGLQKSTLHPNGALDLVECFLHIDAAAFDKVAHRYESYLGWAPQKTASGCQFELGSGRLSLLTESGLAYEFAGERAVGSPAYVGFAVAVKDLALARAHLEKNNFPVVETKRGDIFVPSSAALGVVIVFRSSE